MKRDQVVGIAAAIVAAVSAALPWIKNATVLYETSGKATLGAFSVPVTFVITGPSKTPGGSTPAVAVAVAVVALGLLIWTFLPRTPRRVLYIVWGLIALAAPVLLYLELQKDLDAKHLTTTVFTHYGLGPFFLVGGGILAIVAGIIGAGKKAEAPLGGVAAEPFGSPSPYGTPDQYGVPAASQPVAPYAGDQNWVQPPNPYGAPPQPSPPVPVQPGQNQGQAWGVPQSPGAPQPWDQPDSTHASPQQWGQPSPQAPAWDQPAPPTPPSAPPQSP